MTKVALVVEDNKLLRELAVDAVALAGFEAVPIESAEGALQFLEHSAGDVAFVFADIRTPGELDGLKLAQLICDRWASVRVLLVSGYQINPRVLPPNTTFLLKPWRVPDVVKWAASSG